MENEKKGFWRRIVEPYGTQTLETYGQGSVGSYGGTSPLIGVQPPLRPTGVLLDERTALGISAVSRAVSIIADSLSQLPLDIYRGGDSIELSSLIKRPDVRMSRTQFLALTTRSLAIYGNCYWRLHRAVEAPFEQVSTIEVLNPELVLIEWVNGRKVYHYGDTKFQSWQVEHLMVNPTFESGTNMVMGAGPIQLNRSELQAVYEMHSYINDFFLNNGIPSGVLQTDQDLAPDMAEAISDRWHTLIATGRVPVLPNGVQFNPVSFDPEKAQYIAASQKAITDIGRMFGIPANLLLAEVNGDSTTYSNVQDDSRILVRHTLTSYVNTIENGFTEILPRGQQVKFNLDAFLRGNTKERYEAHKVALEAGFLTVNEVRQLEDLPPLQGGTTE